MSFIGQASLRRAISEFTSQYHTERNNQGLANRLIRKRTPQRLFFVNPAERHLDCEDTPLIPAVAACVYGAAMQFDELSHQCET